MKKLLPLIRESGIFGFQYSMKLIEVLKAEDLLPGKQYPLGALPDNILFTLREKKYKTITYPKYNTMNMPNKSRPCMDMVTFEEVMVKYGEVVSL